MEVFKVIEPGLFSVVQDIGRFDYRRFGIAASGPMDDFSFRIGNILLGNSEIEAALEVTLIGPTMVALSDTAIAVTGAELGFTLNSKAIPMWQAIGIKKGDMLVCSKFLRPRKGCRAYICVAGGIDVPIELGSKSTSVPWHIGGIEGRTLVAGDTINNGELKVEIEGILGRRIPSGILSKIGEIFPDPARGPCVLKIVMGPFNNHFGPNSIGSFLKSEYVVTPEADRTGYRLQGPDVKHNSKGPDIITTGHLPGAIQVPGSLKPIIFLHERSAGGYAIIATVISSDLCKVGQLKPGERLRFQKVSLKEAHLILKEYEKCITDFKAQFLTREEKLKKTL